MKVTIEISEELAREARQRAVATGKSLADWVADLIQRKLSEGTSKSGLSLLELIGDERTSEVDVEFPRYKSPLRMPKF